MSPEESKAEAGDAESKGSSVGSGRPGRPHITLTIPPQRPPSIYAGTPLTPITALPADGSVPFTMFQAYPNKATEFMFKQFEGFRDFTKSGLSVGEKVSFWIYGKVASLSKKWFTHCFLFFVVAGYSLLGGLIFHYVEGGGQAKMLQDIDADRKDLVLQIRQLFEIGGGGKLEGEDELRWQGQTTKAVREYEAKLKEFFKTDSNIIDKGEKYDWDYWSAVFYCGTIFTTIGKPPKA